MRTFGLMFLVACAVSCEASKGSVEVPMTEPVSIVQHVVTDIDGKSVPLSTYKGKVLLLVNTASECGYTPQYGPLEALYRKYKDRGLVVIGFPSNDFGGQEPGTNEEVKEFACEKYDITFPLMSKVGITGASPSPLYRDLQKIGPVKWNFHKFLVDKEGRAVRLFPSKVKPDDAELVGAIEALL